MLEEISANDRGDHQIEHLAGIQAQLRPNPHLGLLLWCPREVLELERWSDPNRAYSNKAPSGESGHIKRLLACLILLRNGAYLRDVEGLSEEYFFLQTSAASLLRFTGSALELNVPKLGLGFLLWLFEFQTWLPLKPFTGFCVLALAASIDFDGTSEQNIVQIANWVDAAERRCRKTLAHDVDSEQWLIGINSYERRERKEWFLLAQKAFDRARRPYAAETRAMFQCFLDRLAGT